MKRIVLKRWVFVLALCLAIGLPAAGPAPASETGNVCVRDYQPGATCKANDVRVEELKQINVVSNCTDATPDTAEIVFEMVVGAGNADRYDVGVFLALDGGSALTGNSCFHDFFDPPLDATPTYGEHNVPPDGVPDIKDRDPSDWPNLETGDAGDTCGDIEGSTQLIKTLVSLVVACTDSNLDGSVDISVCSSWDNNQGETCTGVSTAVPGTGSKCGCQVLELDIPPGEEVDEPAIAVSKQPDLQTVVSGGTATFTIHLSNVGNEDIDNVAVSDDTCDAAPALQSGDDGDNVLETDETWIYTCSVANVTQNFTNTASASGQGEESNDPVSASDTADTEVIVPAISLEKTPPQQGVVSGHDAQFTLTVRNTGDVELSNVVLTDVPCDELNGPFGDNGDLQLSPGEVWTYSCTVEDVEADFTNTANVTADPPVGSGVGDEASADVVVVLSLADIPTLSAGGLSGLVALLVVAAWVTLVRSRAKSEG